MHLTSVIKALGATAIASLAFGGSAFAQATNQINFTFAMVAPSGAEPCIPAAKGRVTITHSLELVENMHVEVTGLPKNTDFDLFVIQVPNFPFGLSWYMGDMLTDNNGEAVGDFVGRFNIGTFMVALGSAAAPVVLPDDANTIRPPRRSSSIISVFGSTRPRTRESWLRHHGDAVQLDPQCWGGNPQHKQFLEREGTAVLRASLIRRAPSL